MSAWIIGLFIGLPVSVWLLAAVCAIIDEPAPLAPLARLSLAVCVILGLLLLTDRAYLYPLLVSGCVVVFLHSAAFFVATRSALGVPIYERAPAPTPILQVPVKESVPEQIDLIEPR